MIPWLTGIVVALFVSAYARVAAREGARVLYPAVLAATASYYVLFAVIGGGGALVTESTIATIFVTVASAGFRWSRWIIVAGLVAHGVLDIFHGSLVANSGVPAWWPAFCLAFDLTAALILGYALDRGREAA